MGVVVGIVAIAGLAVYWKINSPVNEDVPAVDLPRDEYISRDVGNAMKEYKIVFVGDVMVGRTVNRIAAERNDWGWVFEDTREILASADMTIGNLEGPIVEECPITDSGFIFCGDLRWASEIARAGFDVMSLANNHATNYGDDGIESTVRELASEGVEVVGIDEAVVYQLGDVSIGVLAYNDVGVYSGVKNVEDSEWESEIRALASEVDVVFVYYHWGWEYTGTANPRQVEVGRRSVLAGADVVVGAHPHWVQNIEEYEDGYIFYSLGNFVFDQMWSEETRRGMFVEIRVIEGELAGYETKEILIEDYGRPVFVE